MPTLNIAHRGGAALLPENTMAAFEEAYRLGCDGIELDIQLSADGVPVVYHDKRVNRYTARWKGAWLKGKKKWPAVRELNFAALQKFDVGRPKPGSLYSFKYPLLHPVDGERIPTLETVVQKAKSAPRKFILFVELKSSLAPESCDPVALADAVLSVIEKESYFDHCIFISLDWRSLAQIRQRRPDAPCWFTTEKLQDDAEQVLDAIVAAGGKGWLPTFEDVTPQTVALARARGLAIGAWTVDAPHEMRRLIGLGIDMICTDRPDLLQALKKSPPCHKARKSPIIRLKAFLAKLTRS